MMGEVVFIIVSSFDHHRKELNHAPIISASFVLLPSASYSCNQRPATAAAAIQDWSRLAETKPYCDQEAIGGKKMRELQEGHQYT